MAAFTTIAAGIGAVAAIGGLALQATGIGIQMDAAEKQSQASNRAERLRETQMNLESARQKRQSLRNAIRARSMALSATTAQGATGSSGAAGGQSQIVGETGRNIQGISQGQEIGAGIFAANRDVTSAGSLASFGSGLSSLGGALVSNSGQIGQIGQYAFGKKA